MSDTELVSLSHSALSLYAEVCRPVCRELGLGQTAFDILMLLANYPQIDTAGEVVRVSGIRKNLVSMNVEKLVQLGYVERQPMDSDRRRVRLQLTEKAGPAAQRGRRVQKYYYDFLVRGLTEEELAVCRRCTRTVDDNLAELERLLRAGSGAPEPADSL